MTRRTWHCKIYCKIQARFYWDHYLWWLMTVILLKVCWNHAVEVRLQIEIVISVICITIAHQLHVFHALPVEQHKLIKLCDGHNKGAPVCVSDSMKNIYSAWRRKSCPIGSSIRITSTPMLRKVELITKYWHFGWNRLQLSNRQTKFQYGSTFGKHRGQFSLIRFLLYGLYCKARGVLCWWVYLGRSGWDGYFTGYFWWLRDQVGTLTPLPPQSATKGVIDQYDKFHQWRFWRLQLMKK